MSSIRQQIVDAIEDRLALIQAGHVFSLSGGGSHTCTTTLLGVYPWRKVPFGKAQVPAVAFWDTVSDPAEAVIGCHGHALQIEIVGFLAGGTSINAARELLADINAAIGVDYSWSGLADTTEIEKQSLDVEQAGETIAAVQIVMTINYTTGLWRI